MQLSLLEQARVLEPGLDDRQRIERIAADTIAELNERPPIDLDVVASYRDITEIRVETLPVAGMLTPTAGRLVMAVSSADSRRRRRFTGFHEVAHTFLPGYRDDVQRRCPSTSATPRPGNDPEVLCDLGAAEFLLPSAFFVPDLLSAGWGIDMTIELADSYDASIQATAYRVARFWPEPSLLLILEPGLRKEERDDPGAVARLRVRLVYGTGTWPYIPRNKSAADDGVLVRAWHGEVVNEEATLDELGVGGGEGLRVSARRFTYASSDGPRTRVMALYRRPI